MYIKITNGIIKDYSIARLRQDNPQVSFPETISKDSLAEWNVFLLKEIAMPEVDYTKVVSMSTPAQIENEWVQTWLIRDATQEEMFERTIEKENEVRNERNSLLNSTDWTQMADSSADKTIWGAYRQALRDITFQQGFPWNITWPTPP